MRFPLFAALFVTFPASLSAQHCVLAGHAPTHAGTCLISEYITALRGLDAAERDAAATFPASALAPSRSFMATRGRLIALQQARSAFIEYRTDPDSTIRNAAMLVLKGILILAIRDSSALTTMRDVLDGKLTGSKLDEAIAQVGLENSQIPAMAGAMAGEVLDAPRYLSGTHNAPANRMLMTVAERNALIAQIDAGSGKGRPQTAWATTASMMRKSLLEPGWEFRPRAP